MLHRVPLRRIGDAKALNVSHTRVPHPNGAYHTSPGQARHARRPGLRTQNDFLPFSLFRSPFSFFLFPFSFFLFFTIFIPS